MEETVRELSTYADRFKIRDLVQNLMTTLLRDRPEDPVSHLLVLLRREQHAPRVVIFGPPGVGKRTLAQKLCSELGTVRVSVESLQVDQSESTSSEQAALLRLRLLQEDCLIKGWVLHGVNVLSLQQGGVLPDYVVLLDAPLDVLVVRIRGRMKDPLTGEVYHRTFVRPLDDTVVQRLVPAPGPPETRLESELRRHRCDVTGLSSTYQNVVKTFNADVPPLDLYHQALTFIRTVHCNRTPRVLLLGPPGSGKSLQAELLSDKYKMVDVCSGRLLRSVAAGGSTLGLQVRAYVDEGQPVPGLLLFQVLEERLRRADCSSRGWILHGVPRDLEQLRWLQEGPHRPNRVFLLDLEDQMCLERVSLRSTDPVTGHMYHAVTRPAPTDEVQNRLKIRPEDQVQPVSRLLEQFKTHMADLQSAFPDMIRIDADQDPASVLETLEQRLTTN